MGHSPSEHEALQIFCGEDCGNAPKKALLKEFNIAFARGDVDFMLEHAAPNIVWEMVGDRTLRGKDEFAEALDQLKKNKATELHIHNIITHGNVASANGLLKFGEKSYAFSAVYRFNSFAKSAKIKEITSYVIDVS